MHRVRFGCSAVLRRGALTPAARDVGLRGVADEVGEVLDARQRGGTSQLGLLLAGQTHAQASVAGAQDVPGVATHVAHVADVPAGVGQVLELAIERAPLIVVVAAVSGDVEQLLLTGADQARTLQDREQPHQPLDRPELVPSSPGHAPPQVLRNRSYRPGSGQVQRIRSGSRSHRRSRCHNMEAPVA